LTFVARREGRHSPRVASAARGDQARDAIESALGDVQGPELAGKAAVGEHVQGGSVHEGVAAALGLDPGGQVAAGVGGEGQRLELAPGLAEVPLAGGVDRRADGVDRWPEGEAGGLGSGLIGEGALGVRGEDERVLRSGRRGNEDLLSVTSVSIGNLLCDWPVLASSFARALGNWTRWGRGRRRGAARE